MSYGHIVLASTKSGFVPNAIKFITKSKYSHSLITIPDILNIPACIEAAENGVSIIRFDVAYTQNPDQEIEIYEVNVPQDVKDKSIKECLTLLETRYGFLEMPWFIWRAINLLVGRDIKNQNNWTQNGTICSELCVDYLNGCGLGHLFKDFGKGSVNAQDLKNIIQQNAALFKRI